MKQNQYNGGCFRTSLNSQNSLLAECANSLNGRLAKCANSQNYTSQNFNLQCSAYDGHCSDNSTLFSKINK